MSAYVSELEESQLGASRLTSPNYNTYHIYHNDHSYQVAQSYHIYTSTTVQPFLCVALSSMYEPPFTS